MKNKYEIRKAEAREISPSIDLLPPIPYKGRMLDVAVFGPDNYKNNLEKMSKEYFHSKELPKISFKPATTSESLSIASYNFKNLAKPQIFDPRWLQAGYMVKTQDGVFLNTKETDESVLKSMLNKCEKVNGIYLGENDFVFALYESFETGVQNCDAFLRRGLARALECTKEKVAKNLRTIASPKHYTKGGVNVEGFDKVNEPVLKVVGLYSDRHFIIDRLGVVDNDWVGNDDGYAFGIVKENN